MKNFKFHYNTIGDCFYDIYCQPNCTKKEDYKDFNEESAGDFEIDTVEVEE